MGLCCFSHLLKSERHIAWNSFIFAGFVNLISSVTVEANQPWNAEKVMKRVEKSLEHKTPFKAKVRSKMMVANRAITDSGTIESLSPHCQKITWANTIQSTCGDTTWARTPNGDVTRSLGATPDRLSGLGGSVLGMLPLPNRKKPNSQGSGSSEPMIVVPGRLPGTLGLQIGQAQDEIGLLHLEIDTLMWAPIQVTYEA